ncbi:50S ribosomal protein L18e [archaeon]|nr:50S ribosomal protein L18e [archaeon]
MTIKSKTKIETQLRTKTNPELVEVIVLAKKNPAWIEVASLMTSPGSKTSEKNLSEIQKAEGKTIVVPGKVLSQGEITKKVKVVAFKFSEKAKEKLKNAGCEAISLKEEILNNKEAKEVTILK